MLFQESQENGRFLGAERSWEISATNEFLTGMELIGGS